MGVDLFMVSSCGQVDRACFSGWIGIVETWKRLQNAGGRKAVETACRSQLRSNTRGAQRTGVCASQGFERLSNGGRA